MKPTLEEQWEAVLEHWWDNVRREEQKQVIHPWASSCAFCQARDVEDLSNTMEDDETDGIDCFGEFDNEMCPIADVTEMRQCKGTPWFYVAVGTLHNMHFIHLHSAVFAWWLEDCHAGRPCANFTRSDFRLLATDWGIITA